MDFQAALGGGRQGLGWGVVRGKTRVLADDWDVWAWLESITDGVLATSRRRSIFSFQAAYCSRIYCAGTWSVSQT